MRQVQACLFADGEHVMEYLVPIQVGCLVELGLYFRLEEHERKFLVGKIELVAYAVR